MSNDILNSLSKFSFFKSKINYFLLETSDSLKKEQKIKLKGKKNIFWIKKLKNFKKKNLAIISNEFFDALPVKQLIKKENTWLEKNIFFNKSANKLDYIFKKPKNSLMKQIKNIYNLDINTFIEFSPKLENIIKDISKILMGKNSIFLTIDYGDYSEICNDTVQAIYNNKKAILLENIGDSDITYQINFFHLIKLFKNYKLNIVDFTSQSKFLQRLGIKERFEHSAKNLNPMQRKKLSNSIARLLHPSQMGDLFKVLIVSKINKNNQNLQYDI
jgi:cyclopropane-fatty-acyl-phospholipid synthase